MRQLYIFLFFLSDQIVKSILEEERGRKKKQDGERRWDNGRWCWRWWMDTQVVMEEGSL